MTKKVFWETFKYLFKKSVKTYRWENCFTILHVIHREPYEWWGIVYALEEFTGRVQPVHLCHWINLFESEVYNLWNSSFCVRMVTFLRSSGASVGINITWYRWRTIQSHCGFCGFTNHGSSSKTFKMRPALSSEFFGTKSCLIRKLQ